MNFHESDFSISNFIEHEQIHPINNNSRTELIRTVKLIEEWMISDLKENSYNSNLLHLYLFPIGSITYHKSFPDNSKDFLICFPGIIKPQKITDSLVPYLNRTRKFQSVTNLVTRFVPVLQLTRLNCVFEIVICFLPAAYCLTKKPSFNQRNPPQSMLEQMDLKSILALNSLRNCSLIRDHLAESFPLYQETLFQLKKWSILRLIYEKSSSYYLNGTALSVMLACVFRKTGTSPTTVIGTLYVFFRHFLELNFAKRSISLSVPDFRDNMRPSVMENPDYLTPQSGVLTILTPAMPHQNCTRRVNRFVLDRIVDQFKEAFIALQKFSSKIALYSSLMQPLTLVDFLRYAQSIGNGKPQLVLVSIVEREQPMDRGDFFVCGEMIAARVKHAMSHRTVIHYPLAISNVWAGSELRVRRLVVCDYDGEARSSAALSVADCDLPTSVGCTIEEIVYDDCRLASMNFDNVEKIVRLIYTDI